MNYAGPVDVTVAAVKHGWDDREAEIIILAMGAFRG